MNGFKKLQSVYGELKRKLKHKIKCILHCNDLDVEYLRSCGCKIGNRVSFFDEDIHIDLTRPWLIEIGDDVKITKGVTILTHGYDFAVLRNIYHETIGSAGKVTIGNNVFVGMNTTILKGVTVGDNVIIGAGSLVNKDVPSNCVIAGNPARKIMSIDEYYQKRKDNELKEAVAMAQAYYKRFSKVPPQEVFHEFFFLFAKRSKEELDEHGFNYTLHIKDPEAFLSSFLESEPIFSNFEQFIEYCDLG